MPSNPGGKQAVLLAGGAGTRLRPYTTFFPKPLVPIGNHPIVEIVIRQLAAHGFTDITLAVGHLAELIMAYCGDGSRWGVQIRYSREEQPLGTAGPLGLIAEHLRQPFLVMNGDLLTDIDFANVHDYHQHCENTATVVLSRRRIQVEFGVVHVDDENRLTGWSEKPTFDYLVSAGIYVFDPSVLSEIPKGQWLDLPQLIMNLVGQSRAVRTYVHEGYWLDIGRPDDYQRANEDFADNASLRDIGNLATVSQTKGNT
jgi:NDP-sugar pyrophosphorylase family protein